ncbi:MAG: hypothetical protein ACXVJS_14045 [Acidimicrobiia bacterium]
MGRALGLIAVVLVVAAAGCGWARPRFDAGNTGNNPFESAITAGNVSQLERRFVAGSSTPDVVPTAVVARGHLYVGGSPARVYDAAGLAGCPSGTPRVCSPQWSLDTYGEPDVIGSTLYLGLIGYDADGTINCAGAPKICTRVFSEAHGSAPNGSTDPNALHLTARVLSGHGGEHVSMDGYDAPCAPDPAPCPLRWSGALGDGANGGVIGGPAVAAPRVFASYSAVGAPHGTLFAYDGTTGQSASVLWSASLPGVGGTPIAVADGVVVTTVQAGAVSELVAYDAAGSKNCSGTPVVCQPLWTSDPWTGAGFDAAPAIAGGRVYRAVGSQLRAYDLDGVQGCSGVPVVCQKLWVGGMGAGITAPAVANGLVFVGDATGHVDAFDAGGAAGCSATTHVCAALWSVDVGGAVGPPEVAGGRVYVPAIDGNVHVFGLS